VAFLTLLVWTSPTAQGHQLGCVARFWGWQVWKRVTGRPIQVVFRQGWRLELPIWSELAGITAATGLHEAAEELFVFAYVRPGDAVVDVGANLGIYAISSAALGARVSAFEPSSRSLDALRRNVTLNGLEQHVRVFPIALGDTSATVSLTTEQDVGNHLVGPGEGSESDESVPLRPLDLVVADCPEWFAGTRIVLLKIDVEGHDAAVLRGARHTLASDRPVVIVETWDGGVDVRKFLADLGYRVYRYEFHGRRLVEYASAWAGQANFIAVPDDELKTVERRIQERPPPVLAPPQVRWLNSTA